MGRDQAPGGISYIKYRYLISQLLLKNISTSQFLDCSTHASFYYVTDCMHLVVLFNSPRAHRLRSILSSINIVCTECIKSAALCVIRSRHRHSGITMHSVLGYTGRQLTLPPAVHSNHLASRNDYFLNLTNLRHCRCYIFYFQHYDKYTNCKKINSPYIPFQFLTRYQCQNYLL